MIPRRATLSPYRGKPKATCSAGGFFTFDREVGWALPTTPKGSELVAENSKIIQKRPYVYQEIDGKRVEVKGRFVIQDADIHADSGLQPNGVNLSYLPQKSPLEKGDKGGCSNQIILNLMTLGVRPKPMNVLNPDVYTTGKVLDDINDGVQVANLNPQSVEECRLGEACPELVERAERTQQNNDGFASLNPSYTTTRGVTGDA